ncbi:MAG: ribosomal subunit interface protein [Pseudomonadota bacterium]|jgi:putative sigma-54 modulation protein
MKVNVSGHHIEITESLQAFVEDKMSKLERHFDGIVSAQVTLTVVKDRMTAESNLSVGGPDLHASAESDDMYTAIDQMVEKLIRQLQKHKEKIVARKQGQN